jgi:hypothetical protein
MRKLLFLSFMIATVAFCFTPNDVTAQAPLLYTGEMGPDTVNSGETIYHYPNGTNFATARRFKDLGNFEYAIQSDSLSGATNVAITVQVSYDLAGTVWYDAYTHTSNGAASQVFRNEDTEFTPTWIRIKYVGTGTQATKVQSVYSFKRRL